MDNGKCSKCLASSYGRLTKFGIIVVSVVVSAIAGLVPLFVLQACGAWLVWGLSACLVRVATLLLRNCTQMLLSWC